MRYALPTIAALVLLGAAYSLGRTDRAGDASHAAQQMRAAIAAAEDARAAADVHAAEAAVHFSAAQTYAARADSLSLLASRYEERYRTARTLLDAAQSTIASLTDTSTTRDSLLVYMGAYDSCLDAVDSAGAALDACGARTAALDSTATALQSSVVEYRSAYESVAVATDTLRFALGAAEDENERLRRSRLWRDVRLVTTAAGATAAVAFIVSLTR